MQVIFKIFTLIVENLDFTEHSQLLQIFGSLYTEKNIFFLDKSYIKLEKLLKLSNY